MSAGTKNPIKPGEERLPRHIAIIPDGNRRWAKNEGLPPGEGHRQGVKKFHEIMDEAFALHIPCLTFWAASEANLLKRSPIEVKLLVSLLKKELASKEFRERLVRDKVRVHFVGRWNEILKDAGLAKSIHAAEVETEQFTESHLTILFGYDGREEMLVGIENIVRSKEKVSLDAVTTSLPTGFLPPVDLVIRTGEEQEGWTHWSAGFMMWLTADAQFYFTKTFWPGFSAREFNQMLKTFSERERRMGK